MRPVNRGQPRTYNPSGDPTVTEALVKVQDMLSTIRDLSAEMDRISALMRGRKRPRSTEAQNVAPEDIEILDVQANCLRQAWRNAVQEGAQDDLDRVGQKLTTNLNRQSILIRLSAKSWVNLINKTYPKSRADLISNIGEYCSYCEMPLGASLAVEHMLPRNEFPESALEWANFLLACSPCNSVKGRKPSRANAVLAAVQRTKDAPQVTDDEVRKAGYGLVVWPTDDAYSNFGARFRPVPRRVAYVNPREPYRFEDVRPDEIVRHVSNATLVEDGDDGDQITVRFYDKWMSDVDLGRADLKAALLSVSDGTSVNPVNVLPRYFQEALVASGWKVDSAGSTFTLIAATESSGHHGFGWTLQEERSYRIDMSGDHVPVKEGEPNIFGGIQTALLRKPLQNGVLPEAMVERLACGPFEWAVSVDHSDRKNYRVDLSRELAIRDDFGTLSVYCVTRASIEVLVTPILHNDDKATNAVEYLGLNRRRVGDLELSDRRIAKRTRAWLTAVATIRRVVEVWDDEGAREDMLLATRYTIVGTGFWSIWFWLVSWTMSNNHQAKAALLAVLLDEGTFPGTRKPT